MGSVLTYDCVVYKPHVFNGAQHLFSRDLTPDSLPDQRPDFLFCQYRSLLRNRECAARAGGAIRRLVGLNDARRAAVRGSAGDLHANDTTCPAGDGPVEDFNAVSTGPRGHLHIGTGSADLEWSCVDYGGGVGIFKLDAGEWGSIEVSEGIGKRRGAARTDRVRRERLRDGRGANLQRINR